MLYNSGRLVLRDREIKLLPQAGDLGPPPPLEQGLAMEPVSKEAAPIGLHSQTGALLSAPNPGCKHGQNSLADSSGNSRLLG